MITAEAALAGLTLRQYAGEQDVPAMTELRNAEHEADRVPRRSNVGDMRAWFSRPSEMFDPARDVTLAFAGDELVAWTLRDWVDTNDGEYREYSIDGKVHPAWRGRGIGSALLLDNERRSRELAATHDTGRRKVLGTWCYEPQAARNALVQKHGYEVVRWFFEMTRPDLEHIPQIELPARLEIRPVARDDVYEVWKADLEAFRDHWGGDDESHAAFERWMEEPSLDPSLWIIAFDGDQVAGGVVNTIHPEENQALGVRRGWLDSVFTRRPWRRRGLARALIARSLAVLREQGMSSAVLAVDADNPTGALGLYESVGFQVSLRSTAWRKPMDVADER